MIDITNFCWNEVKYIDCMDPDKGLPSIPDKSIDLCLTDPPFGINFKGKKDYSSKREIVLYRDDHLFEWNLKWFSEMERICNGIVFTCGYKYFFDWIKYKKPNRRIVYHYKSNACGFNGYIDPILAYGKIENWARLRQVIDIPLIVYPAKLIHPTPKIYNFWYYLLNKLKPKSVIDPFLGSGTTAEVCTKLGIPWVGYEINEVYSQDINKRLKNCKKEKQQVSVGSFL
ncbi:hypothetical protein LCGC14_0938190 [marine sediment metagenome]|uniref:DNA methylase N-4/N-6 domain-containing protein n=1 Tax=marine sediment metagenome TaxID=412755 RepID=A0A0F9RS84_9ZZZZ|nr:hypothetical protein [bacterium]